ncbi:queuine tRNA-ribosyltransferase [Legionella birminghamensis]|uniref:Queuine tRNA-ribosyltransferase n=1 Tax=Legionella birminghamensis TaxID=28083 RepID=A0A378I7K1_9GAMM|nr:hypothetical protein [Legionella birminghamensis]KTC68274.1 queuine tRNA-ribosyltransferase [Legionella birminghamensis]STX31013.1 queuine tRNA-ribosyltransferase [Legionella birminghamensis]
MSGNNQFIPVITTAAGTCLTMANWKAAGVSQITFYLDELLMKPGLAFFEGMNVSLQSYCGWSGDIVLNLSSLQIKNDQIVIRSHYDGQIIRIDLPVLAGLISTLNPAYLVLPITNGSLEVLWRDLPASIKTISSSKENADSRHHSSYLQFSDSQCFEAFYNIAQASKQPLYIAGRFNWQQFQRLAQLPLHTLESDQPASDALLGQVYTESLVLDIQDETMRDDHQPIDRNCGCEACRQGLTRAYFHHLLQHTPLLCQRFLIQHNIHYCLHHLPEQQITI